MKITLNVRHRPKTSETIDACFAKFRQVAATMPLPWGISEDLEVSLPLIGKDLSTDLKLRGILGRGLTGSIEFLYRSKALLRDFASHDDFLIIQLNTKHARWSEFCGIALEGYVDAMGAYFARAYCQEQSPSEWDRLCRIVQQTGKDLDGRDGPLRFGPVIFMDRELCARSCDGKSPEEVVSILAGHVPNVRLFRDGVIIVAAERFPTFEETVVADEAIRVRLGLPIWE